jgi:predicted GNAT family acetyltransferase
MVSLSDPIVYGCFVDNKIVSVASLWNWGERLSDIGILTHPDYRYKGYAKSVCQTLMSENDKLYVWRCDFDNVGSNRLSSSIGFVEVGESFTLHKK